MTDLAPEIAAAVMDCAAVRGATARLDGLAVTASYRGREARFTLPASGTDLDAMATIPAALPTRARGDIREKTLYNFLQDMAGPPGDRVSDARLRDGLADLMPTDQGQRSVLASVAERQYWIHPRATSSSRPFLAPFHCDLPATYDYHGRYKSFRGSFLLFLCWDGTGFDLALPREIIEFLGSDDGLNPLDRAFLAAARAAVPGQAPISSDAGRLEERFGKELREVLANGAFDQHGLDRVRRDLRTILDLKLPRHDKAQALIAGFSLNVALYYYRLAYRLGEGLACASQVLDDEQLPERPDFDGRVLFRVGSAGDRPISASDPCARSWWRLDEQHLLALPASMASSALLHEAALASGAPCGPQPDPYQCAQALAADPDSRVLADFFCAASAAVLVATQGASLDLSEPGAGGYVLREAVLRSFRDRGSALKQRGRDVVNSFVGSFGGELKRSRGRVRFFELDEQVIFLLVKLILESSHRQQMAYRKEFLPSLREYGLAPQSLAEEELLAQALGRLGLLERYSDAGEAMYVRHIL